MDPSKIVKPKGMSQQVFNKYVSDQGKFFVFSDIYSLAERLKIGIFFKTEILNQKSERWNKEKWKLLKILVKFKVIKTRKLMNYKTNKIENAYYMSDEGFKLYRYASK